VVSKGSRQWSVQDSVLQVFRERTCKRAPPEAEWVTCTLATRSVGWFRMQATAIHYMPWHSLRRTWVPTTNPSLEALKLEVMAKHNGRCLKTRPPPKKSSTIKRDCPAACCLSLKPNVITVSEVEVFLNKRPVPPPLLRALPGPYRIEMRRPTESLPGQYGGSRAAVGQCAGSKATCERACPCPLDPDPSESGSCRTFKKSDLFEIFTCRQPSFTSLRRF
jgi:hypothetical protein